MDREDGRVNEWNAVQVICIWPADVTATWSSLAFKTRNAWQSLAYSPLGAAVLPPGKYIISSEPKPCCHLPNVQRMHVVSVCLHNGNIM